MVWWKKTLIILGIFIVLIFLFNSVIMPWYVRHDTLVKVPPVIGLSFEEAKKILDEAGLEGVEGDIRYDKSKPIGTIIDQNPPQDAVVKDGRRIYLVVSGGDALFDVPNIVGRSVRESKFILAQRNLELLEVENRPSAQYPPGTIITQVEQPGTKVRKGTKISVVVSTGIETGDLRVPELIGKNLEEAKKIILLNKLSIGKINYQPSSTIPLNAVIDQYPKANSMAKENQRVDLFVNKVIKPPIEEVEETNEIEEVSPELTDEEESKSEASKDKKEDVKKEKKETIKKEDKSKATDKKDDRKSDEKKTDVKKKTDGKKKTDKPKDKDTDEDEGTKF
jgi:serine/threonine-protein kinase